jgi:hypothetical protein
LKSTKKLPLSGMGNAVFPAPGEPHDEEIVATALLLNPAEMIPQIAESQKKTQPLALIAVAILIQDLFNVHGALL